MTMNDEPKSSDPIEEPSDTDSTPSVESEAQSPGDPEAIREEVIKVLRTIYDPEIPVNIYELGLVYQVDVKPNGFVSVVMTLTSPMCPVAGSLPPEVEMKVQSVPGVTDACVELVWEPTWNMSMMTEAARLQLNLF